MWCLRCTFSEDGVPRCDFERAIPRGLLCREIVREFDREVLPLAEGKPSTGGFRDELAAIAPHPDP